MLDRKKYLIAAIVTNLFSVINFIYLSFIHYGAKFGLSEGKSLCNINQKLNCDLVAVSTYSSIFGIPVSNLGATTNFIAMIILLICWLGWTQNESRLLRYSFWLSLVCTLTSVFMGVISIFSLGTLCLFCILAYVLSFVQNFAVWKAQSHNQDGERLLVEIKSDVLGLFSRFRYVAVLLLCIPLLAAFSHSVVLKSFGLERLQTLIQESVESWKLNPKKEFDLKAGFIQQNGSSPVMTIVEFADFLCPHCRAASHVLHQFVESRPGAQLVLKIFPLDGNCNPSIPQKGDNLRCELAYVALCAQSLFAKGVQATTYIFEQQMTWQRGSLEGNLQKMFQAIGLEESKMSECRNSSQTHDQVIAMAKEGTGIMGTPTIFVNGKELPRGYFMQVLDATLEEIQ